MVKSGSNTGALTKNRPVFSFGSVFIIDEKRASYTKRNEVIQHLFAARNKDGALLIRLHASALMSIHFA